MKLLYDYQVFNMQSHGGISRCFSELEMRLPNDICSKIGVLETNNSYLRERGWDGVGTFYNKFIIKGEFPCKGRLFDWYQKYIMRLDYWHNLNQDYTIKLLKDGEFDIFHPTFFNDYFLPYLKDKPFVLTIHDMIPELYPQYFKADDIQIRMKRELAPLASAIIAVSEHTKQDVIRILNVPADKIHVIYHGAMEDVDTSMIASSSPFDFPYILYVGDRTGYKNFIPFVYGCVEVLRNNPDLKVVCTGKKFKEAEISLFEELGIADRFIHYFVPDNIAFQTLYHYAKLFVYPSDYEGFGIPILEAYQADCPVLLNNASCFPEVAGDAAIYFNGFGPSSDFPAKLQYVLNLTLEERNALIERQRERLKLYSWKKSAEQLAEVYKSVIKA